MGRSGKKKEMMFYLVSYVEKGFCIILFGVLNYDIFIVCGNWVDWVLRDKGDLEFLDLIVSLGWWICCCL